MTVLDPCKMRKILFLVNTNTYFATLIETVLYVKRETNYEPFIVFIPAYPTIKNDLKICEDNQIKYEVYDYRSIYNSSFAGLLIKTISFFNKKVIGLFMLKFFKSCLCDSLMLRFSRKLLKRNSIKLLVLAGDILGYPTSHFIKSSKKLKIKSMVMPLWMAGPPVR